MIVHAALIVAVTFAVLNLVAHAAVIATSGLTVEQSLWTAVNALVAIVGGAMILADRRRAR